jgi:hypothetical protein
VDASRASDTATIAALQRDLRDNLFGEDAWSGLVPSARDFVSSAEKLLRDHRGDVTFDFMPVVLNLAKAVEVQAYRTLSLGLRGAKEESRRALLNGRTVDVLDVGHLTLGAFCHMLRRRQPKTALSRAASIDRAMA